ncbi:MAG TPA: DUF6049 family protein [Nocardioides sp.]|nr:DUF6049 family protein [Nocardioides sp.]
MPRPLSLLPALVAVAATAAPALAVAPIDQQAPAARAVPASDDPLQVTIGSLSPSEITPRGRVSMRGTVTNVSDERWRAINVHAFISDVPLTTPEELDQAALVPSDSDVGRRITIPGTFDSIGSLDPGESAVFSVRLDRNEIPVEAPGVYWFGAHALGNTTEARDTVADGRARTFLPLVSGTRATVRTSLVIQVRRPVRHTRDGRVLGARRWAQDLAPGGSLRGLADLGAAAGARPVTWLVDPAVPEAVQHLVAGNRPRSLGPPGGDDAEPGATASPDDDASGAGPSAPPEPDPDVRPNPAIEPGTTWLDRLEVAMSGDPVLALPFGDPDVSAATDHGPALLDQARRRSGSDVEPFGIATDPAIAPPTGSLPEEALTGLPSDTLTFLSDRALPGSRSGTVFEVAGHRVLFADSGVAQGGPGPDDPLGTVALRQRLLAEAAVGVLAGRRTPLVVVLPPTWIPDNPLSFFSGLEVDWLELTDAPSLESGRELDAERLDYPAEHRAAELPAANFEAADQLVTAGRTLANVLANDEGLDRQVADEALTSLAYGNRPVAEEVRELVLGSTEWLTRRAAAVKVRAPRGVTLSSASGGFATTVVNRLDQPVTVSLDAVTDATLTVETPPTIDLAPRGSQTVVLDAHATAPGVHYVQLVVTDDTGTPLGSSARLPVRSAQVSQVIWLILGVGVGLLFLAIAVRLVRRIRSERG